MRKKSDPDPENSLDPSTKRFLSAPFASFSSIFYLFQVSVSDLELFDKDQDPDQTNNGSGSVLTSYVGGLQKLGTSFFFI